MNTNARPMPGLSLLFLFLALLAALFLILRAEVLNQLPPLNDHAVQRHGWNSVCVYEWCKRLDNIDRYRWNCGGKEKIVFPMDSETWGVFIATKGLFQTITSFPCYDRAYLKSLLKDCTNPSMTIEDLL